MKRKLICALLALVAMLCMAIPAAAEEEVGCVLFDVDNFFTDEEWLALDSRGEELASRYDCGVYLVVLEDFTRYSDGTVEDCAEAIYTAYDLGSGAGRDGVMLLLSMADRDYALIAYGDRGNAAFTDYGKDVISDEFLPYFRVDDWYGGFTAYQNACEELLWQAENGQPVDVPGYTGGEESRGLSDGGKAGVTALLSCAPAAIACQSMKGKMKSARKKTTAGRYVRSGGVNLYASSDLFTGRTQSVRTIQRESGTRSGGGGTTVRSSGFSGKSGKF